MITLITLKNTRQLHAKSQQPPTPRPLWHNTQDHLGPRPTLNMITLDFNGVPPPKQPSHRDQLALRSPPSLRRYVATSPPHSTLPGEAAAPPLPPSATRASVKDHPVPRRSHVPTFPRTHTSAPHPRNPGQPPLPPTTHTKTLPSANGPHGFTAATRVVLSAPLRDLSAAAPSLLPPRLKPPDTQPL
jgi:hypothetical protein